MRVRSWMAALALTAAAIPIGRGLSAWGQGTTQSSAPAKASQEKPATDTGRPRGEQKSDAAAGKKSTGSNLPTIQLNLAIAGLGVKGCDVEVKPANAGCRFRPLPSTHVHSDGRAAVNLRDVEIRGADKMCTVAITVREPGQPAHTIYRGFRMSSIKPGTVPSFTCFVSSRIAGTDSRTLRK
jgi:hypothetical protein